MRKKTNKDFFISQLLCEMFLTMGDKNKRIQVTAPVKITQNKNLKYLGALVINEIVSVFKEIYLISLSASVPKLIAMKILVVEDDIIMLASIEHQLKQEGFEVITATDGRDAMLAFKNQNPDLVITDILMPLTSGLEFLNMVRSSGDKIPIMVLSALDAEDTVIEAFNLGADDFLTKPVKPGELPIRVKRLLKKER